MLLVWGAFIIQELSLWTMILCPHLVSQKQFFLSFIPIVYYLSLSFLTLSFYTINYFLVCFILTRRGKLVFPSGYLSLLDLISTPLCLLSLVLCVPSSSNLHSLACFETVLQTLFAIRI